MSVTREAPSPVAQQSTTTVLSREHSAAFLGAPQFVPQYDSPANRAPKNAQVVGVPQAAYGVAQGMPGALTQLAMGTALRAGLIGLGFYVAGVRGWKPLVVGSVASSATLSLLLSAHHAYSRSR